MSGSSTTTNAPSGSTLSLQNSTDTLTGMTWGPSSDHAGKIIGHLFADGHVEMINADMDAGIYSSLNTRGSSDTIGEY
jgi:prepilin-type processing-associated H-X9-DG protein